MEPASVGLRNLSRSAHLTFGRRSGGAISALARLGPAACPHSPSLLGQSNIAQAPPTVSNLAQLVAGIRSRHEGRRASTLVPDGTQEDTMDTANILIIVVAVLIIGGGVRLVRGRWL